MGVYDIVLVPCPKCNTKNEFQSKGGECTLSVYELEECPQDVLSDVNRHAPAPCDKCGVQFYVKLTLKARVVEVDQDSG